MTPNLTSLRTNTLIATTLLFLTTLCHGQSLAQSREIYSKEFNWRITIPEHFELVPDSESIKMQNKGEAAIENTYGQKVENRDWGPGISII
jgi:hypothetical protein